MHDVLAVLVETGELHEVSVAIYMCEQFFISLLMCCCYQIDTNATPILDDFPCIKKIKVVSCNQLSVCLHVYPSRYAVLSSTADPTVKALSVLPQMLSSAVRLEVVTDIKVLLRVSNSSYLQ